MNNHLKGIILTFSGNICFSIMAVFVGYLKDISSFTAALFRFGIGIAAILLGSACGVCRLRFVDRRLLCIRGILGGTAITLFFYTLTKIGLGRATLIAHLYPAFATIIALFLLKERLTLAKSLSFMLAFSGIYVLATVKGIHDSHACLWDTLAILGAIFSGFAIVVIRKLHTTDSTIAILFAQCFFGTLIVCIPGMKGLIHFNMYEYALLILIGVSATIGQLFMTQGFKYLSAGTGSLLHMTVPLFNMIAGVVLFSEPFGWHEVLAFILITCSCVVLVIKRKHNDIIEDETAAGKEYSPLVKSY